MPQRKNKALLIRAEEETVQSFKKSVSQNKVSTYGEELKCLLMKEGSEVFLDYQECQFFSEYPSDSKHFIQCSYGKAGKRPRKREHCQACAHNKLIKVLMQSREKIQQGNSELEKKFSERQHKLGDLNAEIGRKTKDLEKTENALNMPEQLKQLAEENADLTVALKDEQEKNNYLDDACKELQRQLETLQTVPESVLEIEKRLSEEKPRIAAPAKKAETSKPTQTIQRVTEREETKKERIIETVASDPFTNQEIECALSGQYVDIVKECRKSCSKIFECNFWPEISNGTVPLDAKIRVRS